MEKIIRITGEGRAHVKPDTIEVSLTLKAMDEDYAKSLSMVDNKVYVLKHQLAQCGVTEVKTQRFYVNQCTKRVYDKNNNYKDVFIGFETTHSLNISFEYNTQKLGDVVSSIASTIAEPRLSIDFTSKHLDEAKNEALVDAVARAKRHAEILADASGVKLGELVTINHSFNEIRFDYPQRGEMLAKMSYEEAAVGSSLREIDVDDITVNANVVLEWKID